VFRVIDIHLSILMFPSLIEQVFDHSARVSWCECLLHEPVTISYHAHWSIVVVHSSNDWMKPLHHCHCHYLVQSTTQHMKSNSVHISC
jgi:hypothetical protein